MNYLNLGVKIHNRDADYKMIIFPLWYNHAFDSHWGLPICYTDIMYLRWSWRTGMYYMKIWASPFYSESKYINSCTVSTMSISV